MKRATTTEPRPRPESRGPAPGPRSSQAQERFRSTARQIATQIEIEAAMWQMLGKEPER